MLFQYQIMALRFLRAPRTKSSVLQLLEVIVRPWSHQKIETKLDMILNNYHTDDEIATKILHAAKTKANCPSTCETRCHVTNKLNGNLKIETQTKKPDCRGPNGIHGKMGVQVRDLDPIA